MVKALLVYKKEKNLADDDSAVSEDEIFSNFMAMYLAGTDTTANYLNVMVHFLGKYPHIEAKIRQ